MSDFVKVAKVSDIGEGKMKLVDVDGEDVCLINSGGKIHAMNNLCTHEDGPLNEGHIEGDEVVCPWHQAKFNIQTGKANKETNWAERDVRVYEVKVEGGEVLVKI